MTALLVLLCSLSPTGEEDIHFESFTPDMGMTANMLMGTGLDQAAGTQVEPGELPEGDYIYDLTYLADGQAILVANYMTENLSLIDPATGTVISDIPTSGMRPGAVAACDGYTVTLFPFDDTAAITDASGTLLGTVPTGEQPWRTAFSPDGETAYIACDIDDCVTVVDLYQQTVIGTIENFPFWLQSYGWGSENPRNYIVFSGFEVTPDGLYLAVPNGEDAVEFYSTSTGAMEHSVPVAEAASVALSGDGSCLIALSASTDAALHRIDLSSFGILSTVTVTGSGSGMTKQIAVNHDGSKAFISTSGNTSTLVNFTTGTFTQFSSTYSAFWTSANYDHTLAVSGQYRFSIIDFASETMVAQHQGNTQYLGAVSPVANEAAGCDPMRHEGLYLYSFDNSSVSYDGTVLSGSAVEGDAPRRVAISPDGLHAVVTGVLSGNASIIDLTTGQTVAILPMGERVQNVEFTPDSKYAVICCFESASVKIVDIDTAAVVAEVPTGSRAGNVAITPDGSMACVLNISANTISFVELNGAASSEVAEKPCGIIGVSWACYGVQSGLAISPDGALVLVCDSFNDNVLVYDMSTYEQIASVPVGDFPLKVAFNGDGTRAMVTCYSGDRVYLLDVDGASTSVLGNWAAGDGPLRVAYDHTNDRFGVGVYASSQVRLYDGETGTLQGTESYPTAVWQPMFTQGGELMALTGTATGIPSRIYRGTDYTDLPAGGCTFDFCDATNTAVVAVPGPDMAYVIEYGSQGMQSGPISLSGCISAGPNPTAGAVSFSFQLGEAQSGTLDVYDTSGRRVASAAAGDFQAGENSVQCTLPQHLPSGAYTVKFQGEPASLTGRFALVR
ncbi:MAG TPA: T9SS type A sorting domain-containing protein [Candidatus Sabulitectum sp.]|nr:T9SS type A sorting domain-containing protein [Candidatus Sabulitectum sp.]